jgi:hypothetical protein
LSPTDVTESVVRGDHYGQSNDWQEDNAGGEAGCEEDCCQDQEPDGFEEQGEEEVTNELFSLN